MSHEIKTVSAQLRSKMQARHDRFDQSDLIVPKLASVASYLALLQRLGSIHRELEDELAPFNAVFARYGLQDHLLRKSDVIERELALLASDCDRDERASTTDAQDMDAVRKTSIENLEQRSRVTFAWGMLYVIEGSTLGGMYLAKTVQTSLGHTPLYYGCYGKNTAAQFRMFSDALERYMLEWNADLEHVVLGAHAAYDRFETGLQP